MGRGVLASNYWRPPIRGVRERTGAYERVRERTRACEGIGVGIWLTMLRESEPKHRQLAQTPATQRKRSARPSVFTIRKWPKMPEIAMGPPNSENPEWGSQERIWTFWGRHHTMQIQARFISILDAEAPFGLKERRAFDGRAPRCDHCDAPLVGSGLGGCGCFVRGCPCPRRNSLDDSPWSYRPEPPPVLAVDFTCAEAGCGHQPCAGCRGDLVLRWRCARWRGGAAGGAAGGGARRATSCVPS